MLNSPHGDILLILIKSRFLQHMKKEKVLEYFGGKFETAKAIGVTRQYVGQWPDIIPMGMAYKIEVVTKGLLKVDPALYNVKRERRYGK